MSLGVRKQTGHRRVWKPLPLQSILLITAWKHAVNLIASHRKSQSKHASMDVYGEEIFRREIFGMHVILWFKLQTMQWTHDKQGSVRARNITYKVSFAKRVRASYVIFEFKIWPIQNDAPDIKLVAVFCCVLWWYCSSGLLFTKKTPPYWYRDSSIKLYNGDCYTHTTTSV